MKTIGNEAFRSINLQANISFKGTVEQWNSIKKYAAWPATTINYPVYCTDGEIAKDGTVTYY